MNTVQEIERAIDALTPEQMTELYAWLDQRNPQPIDAQLKADLDVGNSENVACFEDPSSRPNSASSHSP